MFLLSNSHTHNTDDEFQHSCCGTLYTMCFKNSHVNRKFCLWQQLGFCQRLFGVTSYVVLWAVTCTVVVTIIVITCSIIILFSTCCISMMITVLLIFIIMLLSVFSLILVLLRGRYQLIPCYLVLRVLSKRANFLFVLL